jgi:ankyrin repeat protein
MDVPEASTRGRLDELAALLEAGADPDSRGDHGLTGLMVATSGDVIELLIRAGADVNLQDFSGRSALMHQAWQGNLAGVKLLLDAGADPRARDHAGRSAWDYARYETRDKIKNIGGRFVQWVWWVRRRGELLKLLKDP